MSVHSFPDDGFQDEDVAAFLEDDVALLKEDEDEDNDGLGDGEESDPLASGSDGEREQEEEVFGASVDTLLAEGKRGSKKRRRPYGASGTKRRVSEVPNHLTGAMGVATIAYMTKNFAEAEAQLARIIQEAPKAVAPYRTLALVYEERGDMKKSLNYLMFAAHLDRQDRDLWKRCAELSYMLKNFDDAIYCLTMALKGTFGRDDESLRARAQIFLEMGNYPKAIENYIKVSKAVPSDLGVIVSLAKAFDHHKRPLKAEPYLQAALDYEDQNPFRSNDHKAISAHEANVATIVERLVEIRFRQYRYDDAAKMLTRIHERRALGNDCTPFVQRVMLAVCQHRTGSRALASVAFNEFFSSPDVISANPQLMWHVAEACFAGKDHLKTIKAYSALAALDEYRKDSRIYLRRAEAYFQVAQAAEAERDVQQALELVPESAEAKMLLRRILGTGNDSDGDGDSDPAAGLSAKSRRSARRQRMRKKRGLRGGADVERDGRCDSLHTSQDYGLTLSDLAPKLLVPGATGPPHVVGTPSGRGSFVSAVKEMTVALVGAAEVAFDCGGPDFYLHVLAPVLEAALDAPYKSLRSQNTVDGRLPGVPLDENGNVECEEQQLIAAVQACGEDMRALGQRLLRHFSDEEYVTCVERVFDALTARGKTNEEQYLVEVLGSVRNTRMERADSFLRFRLRLVCAGSCIARGQILRGYEEIRWISLVWPKDGRVWWLLARLERLAHSSPTQVRGQSLRLRLLGALRREAKRRMKGTEDIGCGAVMAAAVYSMRGTNNMATPRPAIHLFSYTLRLQPNSANCALGIGVNLLIVARARNTSNSPQVILKAFSYIDEYRRQRRRQAEAGGPLLRAFVEDEIDYNIGRSLHSMGFAHMAAEMYMKVLDREWSGGEGNGQAGRVDIRQALPAWLDVKREAACNIARIFTKSGETGLAAAIVRKFLVF